MHDDIPRDVQLKYEGRWIAWDTEARRVLADGETLEVVGQATQAERLAGKLIWYHHVLPHRHGSRRRDMVDAVSGGSMKDLTLESLAKRVEALETAIAANGAGRSKKDWRKVVGMFGDSEFMREVDEECRRMREAEREAARRGELPE